MAEQMHRWNPATRFIGLRISNIFLPADYAAIPSYSDNISLRQWNLWSWVDAHDVAQACRLALEADVPGCDVFTIAAADTVMRQPSRDSVPWVSRSLATGTPGNACAIKPDGSRGLSPVAARVLARQLREAAEAHHQRALAAIGTGRACPFDLHALLPVPASVLQRGPNDKASLDWLYTHWGTAQALRHVRLRAAGADKRRRSARVAHEFWSADQTPWPVLAALRRRWPDLVFNTRPDYGDA
jgi:hypothetical protein